MSLQTNVFENGRWVTRIMDPYHVRALQAHGSHDKDSAASSEEAPSLGVLSRTLVRSSVIQQVIPARVRHKTKNDVLFISANFVTIMEALGNYQLKYIAFTDDFNSRIRSARILGDRREPDQGDKYNSIRRGEETWLKTHDWPVLTDDKQILHGNSTGVQVLPPHILVLALESRKLIFICGISGISDQVRLLSSERQLPAARSPIEQLGEHIAVDPRSRAMAIAAHEGSFCFCALKSMNVMDREYQAGLGLDPIKEERLVFVEGVILKMEFLYPPQNDFGLVILLLIVFQRGKARMIWYEWNPAATLRQWQFQAHSLAMPKEEWVPLLLIPLTDSATFMIIFEGRIALYRDLLTGFPTRYIQTLNSQRNPEEPGSSERLPIWTQWARPMRSGGHPYTKVEDAIYLCREDGIIQYLEFHNGADLIVDTTHQAGRLGINVDTFFAALDVGPNKSDLLVAGGGTSVGGMWRVETREDPKLLRILANWTPLNHFITLSDSDNIHNQADTVRNSGVTGTDFHSQERILACTGKGKHGSIAELRYGFEAPKIVQTVNIEDEARSGILGVWAFHGFFGNVEHQYEGSEYLKDVTYILFSQPSGTSLIRMRLNYDLNNPEVDVEDVALDLRTKIEYEMVQDNIGLDFSTRTVYAATIVEGLLVQVTETAIIILSLPIKDSMIKEEDVENNISEDNKDSTQHTQTRCPHVFRLPHRHARIFATSIYTQKDHSILLAAVQEDDNYHLQLGNLSTVYEPIGQSWRLQSKPSCIRLQNVGANLLAFVATINSQLQIFLIDRHGFVAAAADPYTFSGGFAVCESITFLYSSSISQALQYKTLMLCGLRNGSVRTFCCEEEGGVYKLTFCEEIPIGHTSVTAMTDATRQSRAILHSDRSLCVLEYPSHSPFEAPATIHNLWITDRDQPAMQQGTLSAITQVVDSCMPYGVPGLTFGSLVCVDGDLLHMLDLDHNNEPQMVPRYLHTNGTPVRVIYSSRLEKVIALYDWCRVGSRRPRVVKPGISFFDIDGFTDTAHTRPGVFTPKEFDYRYRNDRSILLERKNLERFLGITEWIPEISDKRFHLLVINTGVIHQSKSAGRLLIFAVTQEPDGTNTLSIKRRMVMEAPVYTVIVHPDRRSLVYCSGTELCIQTLTNIAGGIKWLPPIKATMRSFARSLSINGPYIYVSSATESFAIFKYADDKLVYQYGDEVARDGLHHVHIPEHSLILASDMRSSVVGLWQPSERRLNNTMVTVFEATFLASITNLRRIRRPLWHRDPASPTENPLVLGSSADGTITQLEILSQGWRLLRFIQNMAERNKNICPFMGQGPFKRHIEPSVKKPHYMHINGDILQRVMENGGEKLIGEMLDAEPDPDSLNDFDSVTVRWTRCQELAAEVVDIDSADWLANVARWIRYRLRNAL